MFLSQISVWLWSRLARLGQIFSMNIGLPSHQPQHHGQQLGDLLSEQQHRQQRLEGGVHIGAVDAGRVGQIGVVVGAQGGQSLQVVAQHLGRDILHDSLLRQARDVKCPVAGGMPSNQQARQQRRLALRTVMDLMAATGAVGDDDGVGIRPHGRQQ